MDWKAEIENNLDVVKRIVMTLCALAVLAARAAGLPYPARRFILWVLSYGEEAARSYVIEASFALASCRQWT